jgi:hypothetical protein
MLMTMAHLRALPVLQARIQGLIVRTHRPLFVIDIEDHIQPLLQPRSQSPPEGPTSTGTTTNNPNTFVGGGFVQLQPFNITQFGNRQEN